SLLSSAWGQVGPPRYRRQANSVSFQPLPNMTFLRHLRNHQNQSLNKLNIVLYESSHKTPSVL
ncbi:hypothetical protein WCU73_20840, partial [Pectobacterium brasiliense]|uniref:hypothetical protein n=1 Tax=Pectobacterium brasiliense TaxID=180957 RepID=UPI003016AC04